jgi:hypothetical protein
MCGRYRLARKKEILAETFDVENDIEWSPRYNVAPGQNVPVVRQDAARPSRSISLTRWGLIPSWTLLANSPYSLSRVALESWPGEVRPSTLRPTGSRNKENQPSIFSNLSGGQRRLWSYFSNKHLLV